MIYSDGTFDECMLLRAFMIIHTLTITGQVFDEGTFDECMVLRAFLIIQAFTIAWHVRFN